MSESEEKIEPFKKHIFVCTNERVPLAPRPSCRGAEVHAEFKKEILEQGVSTIEVRANKAGCLDKCEVGTTVVVYPDAVWYGRVTVDDVAEIVESHIKNNQPVERLRIDR